MCSYMKKKFNIPKFKNEDEEREFWAKIDLSEFFEASDFEKVSFPNLKPTTRSISIRLPEYLIDRIKEQANEINIPYQSLIKGYLKKAVFKNHS
jgi:predicted DNA binding CopG/RHH family protein